ncbi:MAG: hypothetical protein P1Q69_06470 [Candidatus Thorarchaeota archaeon]|nr:hypothetical protein [Candidatus Thorarchaeota archaeon]
MMENMLVVRVSKFAKLYRADYLKELDTNLQSIQSHWFQAFRFLISKILAQGRPAKTGRLLRKMVEDTVTSHFDCKSSDGITGTNPKVFTVAKQTFEEMKVKGRPYKKQNDVDTLFGAETKSRVYNTHGILRFIATLPAGNIVQYSISEIQAGRLIPHYRKLISFYGIGPIAAATYLRDLVDLYHYEIGSKVATVEELAHIQPVDAHVKRVALEVGIEFEGEGAIHQGRSIVEACQQVSFSNKLPIFFSQGASWICANAFEAALKLLSHQNLEDDLSSRFS